MAAAYSQTAIALDDVVVAGFLSRDRGRADEFASVYDGRGYTDLGQFLSGVDAVYIATEPRRHADMAMAVAAAGKPVLVEKPLTPDASATNALLKQTNDTLLIEAIWTLTLPAYVVCRSRLRDGVYGDPKRLQFDFSLPADPQNAPQLFHEEDGGVLRDRAIYGVAAALDLLGPVAEQHALVRRNENAIDTAATLLLTHKSGATSLLTFSFDGVGDNHLNLSCQSGHLRLPALEAEVIATKVFHSGALQADSPKPSRSAGLKRFSGLRRIKRTVELAKAETYGFGAYPYSAMLQHFLDLVREGATRSPIITVDLMKDAAMLIQQARKA